MYEADRPGSSSWESDGSGGNGSSAGVNPSNGQYSTGSYCDECPRDPYWEPAKPEPETDVRQGMDRAMSRVTGRRVTIAQDRGRGRKTDARPVSREQFDRNVRKALKLAQDNSPSFVAAGVGSGFGFAWAKLARAGVDVTRKEMLAGAYYAGVNDLTARQMERRGILPDQDTNVGRAFNMAYALGSGAGFGAMSAKIVGNNALAAGVLSAAGAGIGEGAAQVGRLIDPTPDRKPGMGQRLLEIGARVVPAAIAGRQLGKAFLSKPNRGKKGELYAITGSSSGELNRQARRDARLARKPAPLQRIDGPRVPLANVNAPGRPTRKPIIETKVSRLFGIARQASASELPAAQSRLSRAIDRMAAEARQDSAGGSGVDGKGRSASPGDTLGKGKGKQMAAVGGGGGRSAGGAKAGLNRRGGDDSAKGDDRGGKKAAKKKNKGKKGKKS